MRATPTRGRRFGGDAAHQKAMMGNLVASLIAAESIVTTEAKAKALRPVAEKCVTAAARKGGAAPAPPRGGAHPGQGHDPQALRGDRPRATRSAPAATPASSSSARARVTTRRWRASSSSRGGATRRRCPAALEAPDSPTTGGLPGLRRPARPRRSPARCARRSSGPCPAAPSRRRSPAPAAPTPASTPGARWSTSTSRRAAQCDGPARPPDGARTWWRPQPPARPRHRRVGGRAGRPEGFDARRSATARTYRYLVWNAPVPDPLLARRSPGTCRAHSTSAPCAAASDVLLGEHDFRSFCRRPAGDRPAATRWCAGSAGRWSSTAVPRSTTPRGPRGRPGQAAALRDRARPPSATRWSAPWWRSLVEVGRGGPTTADLVAALRGTAPGCRRRPRPTGCAWCRWPTRLRREGDSAEGDGANRPPDDGPTDGEAGAFEPSP